MYCPTELLICQSEILDKCMESSSSAWTRIVLRGSVWRNSWMAAKEVGPVCIIFPKDNYKFLLPCPYFLVFHKWTKSPEAKYIPCLVSLSLKSNSPKNYPCYCMINIYRVKKIQNINYFYPPDFVQWCLPSAAPCIGKGFFSFILSVTSARVQKPIPECCPSSLRYNLPHGLYSSSDH